MRSTLFVILLAACTGAPTDRVPVLGEPIYVAPSDALPPEVVAQDSNNNLSVAWHDGERFFAWRTAPNHFASPETMMYVTRSSDDGASWQFENAIALGTDVREPQLLSIGGELYLFFAVLGDNPFDFEPGGMMVTHRTGPGEWTAPEPIGDDGIMIWRMKWLGERVYLMGYLGGENVYEPGGEPMQVKFLTTENGLDWTPVAGDGTVYEGGGSESDVVFLDDGSLVAVIRDEAGDEDGFGSRICTAPADDLDDWTCNADLKKYDSPLLLHDSANNVWLIGRRNVTESGNYDLQQEGEHADLYLQYQADYWGKPKRCSVWKVDPDDRTVAFVADLPSKGDTCFPDVLDLDGEDHLELWNYTSPVDGPELSWLEGQTGTTSIYRMTLDLPGK